MNSNHQRVFLGSTGFHFQSILCLRSSIVVRVACVNEKKGELLFGRKFFIILFFHNSKFAFFCRLYSSDGHALIDLLQKVSETPPEVGQKVLCRHPFQESKRAYVIPSRVEPLYKIYWQNGKITQKLPTLELVREKVQKSLKTLRNDHKRTLNPTPYKVSLNAVAIIN